MSLAIVQRLQMKPKDESNIHERQRTKEGMYDFEESKQKSCFPHRIANDDFAHSPRASITAFLV
jgi:hypothetical protein